MSSSFVRAAVAASFVMALGSAHPATATAQDRPSAPQAPVALIEPESEPQGLIAEPGGLTRAAIFADRHFGKGDLTNGFYINHAKMIPGAGWLAAGPGYRHWYKQDSVFVDGSASISIRGYKQAQGRLEVPKLLRSRLALGTQVRWQDFPKVHYFGAGPDTLKAAQTEYRLRIAEPRWLRHAAARALDRSRCADWLAEAGYCPRVSSRRTTEFGHGRAAVTIDTRDFPGHPTRGILLRAAASRYNDRATGAFSFKRYEAEVAGFLPTRRLARRARACTVGWSRRKPTPASRCRSICCPASAAAIRCAATPTIASTIATCWSSTPNCASR